MNPDRLGFAHRAAAGLIALVALVYVAWTWSDDLGSLGGDSAVYVGMARHYAPYVPADPVAQAVDASSQFPPLYPLALALGGGAVDLQLAHLLTTLFLAAAFAAHYAWSVRAGLTPGLAAACVLLFAAERGTYLQSFYVLSETLFVALSLIALAVFARPAPLHRGRACWAASILVAATLMTRTAGVALLPALGVMLWRLRPRHAPLMGAVACAPGLLWSLLHRSAHPYQESLVAAYDGQPFGAIVHRLSDQMQVFGSGLLDNFLQTASLAGVVVAFGAIVLLVAIRRVMRLEADAVYLFGYLALICLWPFPAEAMRFAWVITPLLLTYAVLAARGLSEQLALRGVVQRATTLAVPATIGILLAPGLALALERRFDPVTERFPGIAQLPEWYGRDAATSLREARIHLELARAFRQLGANVPAGECVYSIKPALVAFYAGRMSAGPPSSQLDDGGFEAQLRSGGCHYFLLMGITSPSFPAPYYPYDRLQGRLLAVAPPVLESESGGVLAVLARLND